MLALPMTTTKRASQIVKISQRCSTRLLDKIDTVCTSQIQICTAEVLLLDVPDLQTIFSFSTHASSHKMAKLKNMDTSLWLLQQLA